MGTVLSNMICDKEAMIAAPKAGTIESMMLAHSLVNLHFQHG